MSRKYHVTLEIEMPEDSTVSDARRWACSVLDLAFSYPTSEHPYRPKVVGATELSELSQNEVDLHSLGKIREFLIMSRKYHVTLEIEMPDQLTRIDAEVWMHAVLEGTWTKPNPDARPHDPPWIRKIPLPPSEHPYRPVVAGSEEIFDTSESLLWLAKNIAVDVTVTMDALQG